MPQIIIREIQVWGVRKPQSMNYQSLFDHWKMYCVSHDTVLH